MRVSDPVRLNDAVMADTAAYSIGAPVNCRDAACGKLSRVVLDPVARVLTHLVVQPLSRIERARLVPIELVQSAGQEIRLSCTVTEFGELEEAEETHFITEPGAGAGAQLGYGAGEMLAWPYFGLGVSAGMGGIGDVGLAGGGLGGLPPSVTTDRVPVGELDVRRGEHVHASDGEIGRLQGLVIDPRDHHVTHLLLQEGHLWGKKQVAIPIGAVTHVDVEDIRLNLTRDQVRDLPAVDLES
jgi:sporulation protein YlmC with PRC-barrel domain